MPRPTFPALAALLPLLAACASEMSATNRLDETLRAYHHHLLARDVERASAYVGESAMDAFQGLHGDEDASLEIEDFQILSVRFLPQKAPGAPLRALVMVGLDARRSDSLVIRN